MYSSLSPKDEIWFLDVCHHISTGLYPTLEDFEDSAQEPTVPFNIQPAAHLAGFSDLQ
jgi:hypothetical protein